MLKDHGTVFCKRVSVTSDGDGDGDGDGDKSKWQRRKERRKKAGPSRNYSKNRILLCIRTHPRSYRPLRP